MAFGLLVMGILSVPLSLVFMIPPAMVLGFIAQWFGFAFESKWPLIIITCVIWMACMRSVVRRYLRAASVWETERRGATIIHVVEFLAMLGTILVGLAPEVPDVQSLELFYAVLVIALNVSHAFTYALLRYRPTRQDLIMWIGTALITGTHLSRN